MLPCLKTRPIPWANTELTTDPVFSIDSEAIPRSGVHFPAQKNTEVSTGKPKRQGGVKAGGDESEFRGLICT